jgi:hypothetical protein
LFLLFTASQQIQANREPIPNLHNAEAKLPGVLRLNELPELLVHPFQSESDMIKHVMLLMF